MTGMKQRIVTTTTLVINKPDDYSLLEARFRLVRYVLPERLRWQKGASVFGQVHNTVRDQINAPYKSFRHDWLDGAEQWVIYVLYQRGGSSHDGPAGDIPDLELPWFTPGALPKREIRFAEIPFHNLLKLLHIAFFRGEGQGRFVGEDKCYAYARSGKNDFHHCVEIELSGAPTNDEGASRQEFRIIPHARQFGKVSSIQPGMRTYFGKRIVGNRFYFLHLQSSQIPQEGPVYQTVTFPGRKAQVKFHDPHNLSGSTGKIIYDFIAHFLPYLQQFGITGQARERTFTEASLPSESRLNLSALEIIGVYDIRLRRTYPLESYVELLNGLRPDVCFVGIEQIGDAPECGVLVLLDGGPDDFDPEEGILRDFEDPYPALYRTHPLHPKQSIVVNPHDPDRLEGIEYLDYPLIEPQDSDFALRLDVALSELYLKCAIQYGLARFPLPPLARDRAYIKRALYHGQTYTTALWYERKTLHFADLRDPTQSDVFYRLLEQWNVDWDGKYEALLLAQRRIAEDGSVKDLRQFEIIVGPDLFVNIEPLEERVLYDYPEIVRRQQEQHQVYPIQEFELLPHYEKVKGTAMLPIEEMKRKGLLDGSHAPKKSVEVQSLAFYQSLQAYDAFLAEIAPNHPALSFAELTSGEWLERINHIFGGKPGKDGQYHRRLVLERYHKLEKFQSERGQDVHLYQGIWYDATHAFLVGSPNSMNIEGQARAHLVRRFQVLQGADHFDQEQMLLSMGVQFVRPRQFTVVPYYFHLIDIYVENVLRYQEVV